MTSFCSAGMVKQPKGVEDHSMSVTSAIGNSTVSQEISSTTPALWEGHDYTPQFVPEGKPWYGRTADE